MKQLNIPVSETLQRAHIPMQVLQQEELLISGVGLRQLMANIERDYKVSGLGFKIIEVGGLQHLDNIVAETKQQALTLLDALEVFVSKINTIVNEAENWIEKTPEGAWFCHQMTERVPLGKRVMEQYVIAVIIEFVRLFTTPDWRPTIICYEDVNPDIDCADYVKGAQVFRGQPCVKVFIKQADLFRLNPYDNNENLPKLSTVDIEDFCDSVTVLLWPHFKRIIPTINDAAIITGLSKRTLQRNLAQNNMTYRQLIQDMRFSMAKRLLTEEQLSINQIAERLGYVNPNHFTRAFKRWQGESPTKFRQKIK